MLISLVYVATLLEVRTSNLRFSCEQQWVVARALHAPRPLHTGRKTGRRTRNNVSEFGFFSSRGMSCLSLWICMVQLARLVSLMLVWTEWAIPYDREQWSSL